MGPAFSCNIKHGQEGIETKEIVDFCELHIHLTKTTMMLRSL